MLIYKHRYIVYQLVKSLLYICVHQYIVYAAWDFFFFKVDHSLFKSK